MSDLIRAVRINEEIKHIVDASHQINIVALNAALTARQAGVGARGFAVVSREVRSLAAGLEEAMLTLDQVISRLAANLAKCMREYRQLAKIETAVVVDPDPHPSLYTALSSLMGKHDEHKEAVAADWIELEDTIHLALRLMKTGDALARNAKVEAVYGAHMARQLAQVAAEIESAVEQIVGRLRSIRAMVA